MHIVCFHCYPEFTLAYVVYPEAVTQLPAAPVWSILFFIMLFCLAIDSQFLMVQGVIIALDDEFGQYIPEKKKIWLIFAICLGLFILGLPLTTQVKGGIFLHALKNMRTWFCSQVVNETSCLTLVFDLSSITSFALFLSILWSPVKQTCTKFSRFFQLGTTAW